MRKFVEIWINPLNPKIDKNEFLLVIQIFYKNRLVIRIKDMITQDEFNWYFNNFSSLLL